VSFLFKIVRNGTAVRTFRSQENMRGVVERAWRGRDDRGRRVLPGRYRVVLVVQTRPGTGERPACPCGHLADHARSNRCARCGAVTLPVAAAISAGMPVATARPPAWRWHRRGQRPSQPRHLASMFRERAWTRCPGLVLDRSGWRRGPLRRWVRRFSEVLDVGAGHGVQVMGAILRWPPMTRSAQGHRREFAGSGGGRW
jgi:hypothetical protein